MPPGKKRTRRRRAPKSRGQRSVIMSRDRSAERRLEELAEALDVMLPELAARLAALEHLLVEKQICGRDDLMRSRAFVDIRRGEP